MRTKLENVGLLGILAGYSVLFVSAAVRFSFQQSTWTDYLAFFIMAFSVILVGINQVLLGKATFFGITFKAAIQNEPIKPLYVPIRKADRKRWIETWQVIKPRYLTGNETHQDLIIFLERNYVDLACSDDTLRKIIAAGEAGALDLPKK